MDLNGEERYCKICFELNAKYVCPQCGINYCSAKCFSNVEKHLKCSENFYRRCVEEDVAATSGSKETTDKTKSMKEILERFHSQQDSSQKDMLKLLSDNPEGEEDEDSFEEEEGEEDLNDSQLDSDDDEPLEKRLGDVDLDDSEEVWAKLTPEEREEFKRMVKETESQGVEAVADPWCPGKTTKKLIKELDNQKS